MKTIKRSELVKALQDDDSIVMIEGPRAMYVITIDYETGQFISLDPRFDSFTAWRDCSQFVDDETPDRIYASETMENQDFKKQNLKNKQTLDNKIPVKCSGTKAGQIMQAYNQALYQA